MTGEVLRLGPFVGGLNLASDASSVADEELTVCKNMELDIDGSLKSRPPFTRFAGSAPAGHRIIGSAIFANTGYLFSSGIHSGTESIYFSTDGSTWTEIVSTTYALTCIQYRGEVWFPPAPGASGDGISWNPTGGSSTVADMPEGSHCVVHKERLYIVPGMGATSNSSRLHFSAPADLTDWPGVNFIDVAPGDGETLNAILVYNDNLLLFKNNSVYVLAYDINPADAILREINPVLGASSGSHVMQFENVVYALHDDLVYEIVNYDFNPINVKVPFVLDITVPSGQTRTQDRAVSVVGERLLVKYYAKMYVFGLRTRTWSEWQVTDEPLEQWHDTTKFYNLPNTTDYYARRAYTDCNCVIKMPKDPTVADSELLGESKIVCEVRSKDIDLADPVHYKRLFWWSADILAGDRIKGSASPITYTFAPVWDDMNIAWEDIEGTIANPLTVPLATETEYEGDNNFVLAKTVKFKKAMRFRKINFAVELDTDGRSSTAVKLFSLTITVLTKQTISKAVG